MYLLHRSVGPSVQFLYSGCMIAAKFRIMTIEQRAVRRTAENFVICDTQKSYSENLFRRLSEKLSGYFQFHVFHDIENLKIAAKSMQVNILLIGEEYGKEDRDEIPARQKYLLIGEKIPNERSPTEIPFFRYQSVSSMLELLLQENSEVQTNQIQLVSDRSQTVKANVNGLIGIYSPVHRIGKTRFAMRMGRVLSESIPTLYLNLEGYSGLNYYLPEESGMNLGDLLYYMKQESINPVWKISTLISHMNGVDYIAPIRAEQDFREVTKEEWNQLLDLILEKSIYKVIILDLGDTVDGLYDLLGRCSKVYTPYIEEGAAKAKANGTKVQDAHEAIRPTDLSRTPAEMKESLGRDQFRLYQLIWKRFVASRMTPARYETTAVRIGVAGYRFNASASRLVFEGFRSVYTESEDTKEENNVITGKIEPGMELKLSELDSRQHFTQPPAHYTEASLVRALEEKGIGRPSTYAPTITTIIARRYVTKENKNLYMTELGEVVNNIMKDAFPSIVDVNFTANMESLLDSIGEGKIHWKTVVENFYPDLDEAVQEAEKNLEKVEIADEVTDVVCEECGRNMVIKYGPHGKFLACPGFPDCRNTKPYLEKIGVACPKCGKDIVIRKTKKGRRYYGCEGNPDCDFMSWQKPVAKKCPQCGGYMVEKGNRLVCADKMCGYICEKTEEEQEK